MFLIDISSSSLFGTQKKLKRDLITEIGAVFSFSATTNNDKVGVIFFSDKIEKYIPPKKGRGHILRIIRELIALEPTNSTGTNVGLALEFLNNVLKKRTITFLLSDFVSLPYLNPLQLAARKHDLLGIHVYDKYDKELPAAGLIQVMDAETNERVWLDTDNASVRKQYAASFDEKYKYCNQTFRKSGASLLNIKTDDDYVKILQGYFKGR